MILREASNNSDRLSMNLKCPHPAKSPAIWLKDLLVLAESRGTKNISNRSYNLNSLNGDYIGDSLGDYYRGY